MSAKSTPAISETISLFNGQQLRNMAAEESAEYLVINVNQLKDAAPSPAGNGVALRKKLEKMVSNPLLDPSLALAFFEIAQTLLKPARKKKPAHAGGNKSESIFDGYEQYHARNQQRQHDIREFVLSEDRWIRSGELSDKAHFTNANRSAGPNAWKRRGKTFAINVEGQDRYPDYAFDEAWQPLPVIKQVLDIFDGTRTPWSLAAWFATGNSWLGGRRPKDLLTSDPQAVTDAALQAKSGAQHG
ncbi:MULTISPECIES: DUF2384 domain-containing protein [Erwinia]|uniref:Toxin-antitoxin system antitoxin component (TIGR02293 family) n=1 Tax=Erwinia rhapontici TaxID=55212 RepID=A0ABN6DGQ9_ERWRD|nr:MULTISPECIES: DUF2384 domain-containing protein [Erwinia]MCS3605080.1 hypothetical protein [Erwinia rhapontici]TDT01534.1 hypothetical protein EDF84_101248 [Erwinia rhapontici]UDQ81565.1 DUF2384 domain-containing protein [Erwinia rhapontici]BCQ34013.1 hypothetical protein ERHA53_13560 [Erwinia rhapontici]BCQ38832.1 hypothetical protein ERHA54_14350 [Erwinia rhapontici]